MSRRSLGQRSSSGCCQPLSPSRFVPFFRGFPLHGRRIRRRSRGPRLGIPRCVRQALTTEAIAECIRSGGVWEAESNIDLLDLVSTPAAADGDAAFTVKRINL